MAASKIWNLDGTSTQQVQGQFPSFSPDGQYVLTDWAMATKGCGTLMD
jgi:hypothetical protein